MIEGRKNGAKKIKPVLILKVKIKGEVYDRVYGIKDIQYVIDLFNDINRPNMKITIEQVQEIEKDKMLNSAQREADGRQKI